MKWTFETVLGALALRMVSGQGSCLFTPSAEGSNIVYSQIPAITNGGPMTFRIGTENEDTVIYNSCGAVDESGMAVKYVKDGVSIDYGLESSRVMSAADFYLQDGLIQTYVGGATCASTNLTASTVVTAKCNPHRETPEYRVEVDEIGCVIHMFLETSKACPELKDGVCTAAASCAECATASGCGWCASDQRCYAGVESHPDTRICSGSKSWLFGEKSCPDCASIKSCSECSATPDCIHCKNGDCIAFDPMVERLGQCPEKGAVFECSCPPCAPGYYCPSGGNSCKKVPNGGGMFVGGMFLVIGLGLIGGIAFFVYKKTFGGSSSYDTMN